MLALGSIVYLHEGRQKLIIISRGPIVDLGQGEVYFDYGASLYPVGFNSEQVFYFNEENIDKVMFNGYMDEDEERFQELYTKWMDEHQGKVTKGTVLGPHSQ